MDSHWTHTSRISSVGICGRKSLPTKKHINMKSSTIRSKSITKGGLGILKSYSRYSRRVQMLRNCNAPNWEKNLKTYIWKTTSNRDKIFLVDWKRKSQMLPGRVSLPLPRHLLSHQTPLLSALPFHRNLQLNDPFDHKGNICPAGLQ